MTCPWQLWSLVLVVSSDGGASHAACRSLAGNFEIEFSFFFFHSSRAHFSCAGLDIRIHSTRTNAPGRTSSFFLFVAKLEGRNEVHHVLEVAFGVEVFSAANLGHGRVIVLANADADDGRVLYGDK